MNNFLSHKNEECIKQNSADFYTMSIYSKDILNLDFLRLNEFSDFYFGSKHDNFDNSYVDKIYSNRFKILSGILISSALMIRFKSVLVGPLFFSGYFVTKRVILNRFISHDCNNKCYFCQKNLNKKEKLDKFEKYYEIINYIIDKNPNLSSLDEFEKELELSIRQYKV